MLNIKLHFSLTGDIVLPDFLDGPLGGEYPYWLGGAPEGNVPGGDTGAGSLGNLYELKQIKRPLIMYFLMNMPLNIIQNLVNITF